ncbi:MAG TPA: histidine kinase [Gaiellaceae bacterium]|nr:histidine kinase [Gaiellaceae bacterium]
MAELPLVWRIFMLNAMVFVVGTAALALSPATVSFPIILTEALVLSGGLALTLLLNLFLVRRSLVPLGRLTTLMRRIDLLQPGERLAVAGPAEVRTLGAVFNEMLERLEAERRESSHDKVVRQEEERRLIARELHDEVGQAMTGVMLTLSRLVDRVPHDLRDEVNGAREATRESLDDVRRVVRRLRPEALDDLGLPAALNALTASFSDLSGIAVVCRTEPLLPRLSPEVELALFRVAQESLTNAARHAEARRVEVLLERFDGSVRLRVRDDGRGFAGAAFGSGIRGMRERALLVGGTLELVSPAGNGTEVRLTAPAEGE